MNEKEVTMTAYSDLSHIKELIILVNNVDARAIVRPKGIKFNDDVITVFVNDTEIITMNTKKTRLIYTNTVNETWISEPSKLL